MNRRLSMVLAGGSTLVHATYLFALYPLSLRVVGADASRLLEHPGVQALKVYGFIVTDLDHIGGWLPQLVFLVLSTVLKYAVLRAAPGVRPRIRTVLELMGAMLLAAGLAELLGRAMDSAWDRVDQPYVGWFIGGQLQQAQVASAQLALVAALLPVVMWTMVWRRQRWAPFQAGRGTTDTADGCGEAEKLAPALPTARERRDAVAAGLTVVVLLAIAGAPVLRHSNTHDLEQSSSSFTFHPDLVHPYEPPALIEEWSEVFYPALRMRPLRTESTSGWLATLAACLVLLAVLGVALYAVAVRAAAKRPLRVVMECWSATLLAATAAALVESTLLQGVAPRDVYVGFAFDAASADAVRFGTVWGWATGAAVLVLTRRGRRTESPMDEGRPDHAE
ncbi:hypothetical protein [Streptomyces sp. 7N604]|uniref:hypothetical protein n=1 Tax=Streptomyces sp. 7N604 TaxID=3457415 RepID=UPI003FD501B3